MCGSAAAWRTGSRRWRRRTWTARTTSRSRGARLIPHHPQSSFFACPLAYRSSLTVSSPRSLDRRVFHTPIGSSDERPWYGTPRCSTSGWTSCGWREYRFWLRKIAHSLRARLCCLCSPRTTRGSVPAPRVGPGGPPRLRPRFGSKPGRLAPPLATPLAPREERPTDVSLIGRAEPLRPNIYTSLPATLLGIPA